MRARVALVGVGAVLIAYAMVGVLTDADADPIGVLVFLLAVLVGHDLVWMPVALGAGLLVVAIRKRFTRPRARGGG